MSRTSLTAQQLWAKRSAALDGPRYEVRFRDGLGDYWLLVSSASRVVSRNDQWDRCLSWGLRGGSAFGMARPGNFRIARGRR